MALRLSTGLRNDMLKTGGNSCVDGMADGVIEIRSGLQPSTADDAETGTLLARITLASGDYNDLVTNGINLEALGTQLNIKTAEVWSGLALVDGVAGWFRLYDTNYTMGVSTTALRIDGAVATSGAQMNLPNTNMTLGGTTTIDSVAINFPTA
jgi:hypothetical protein